MKITLNSSAERDQDHVLSRQIAEILIGLGATVWIEQEAAHYYTDIPVVVAPQADCYAGARFAISVGGDGTFIKTAQLSAPEGAPVLGINKGTVGFLTELEEGELPLLGRLFRGDYQLERRMMLEFEVRRNGRGLARGLALNDVTVQRGTTPRLLELDIHQSGYRGKQHDLFITRWRGDGLIVSTPTGSTAYALSCGGPVIDPRSDCIELVPIGAHSLTSRPTIFGNDIELIVTPVSEGDRVAHVFHDGQPILEIQPGDNLMVRKAAISATVVHMKPESFYHTMRQKLRDY